MEYRKNKTEFAFIDKLLIEASTFTELWIWWSSRGAQEFQIRLLEFRQFESLIKRGSNICPWKKLRSSSSSRWLVMNEFVSWWPRHVFSLFLETTFQYISHKIVLILVLYTGKAVLLLITNTLPFNVVWYDHTDVLSHQSRSHRGVLVHVSAACW